MHFVKPKSLTSYPSSSMCACVHACVCWIHGMSPGLDGQETQMESQICLLAVPEAKHITSPGLCTPI